MIHHEDSESSPYPEPLPYAASWRYELSFPCDPRGPGVARGLVRAVLGAHGVGELAERAGLLTTELATNSVRYAKGAAFVRMLWLRPVLRVSVWDGGPDLPSFRAPEVPGGAAEGGRGLFILDALADRWGGCPYGGGGKTVWFELAAGGPPPAAVLAA